MALHLGVPVVAHMKLLRINCKAHHLIPDQGMLHRKQAVDFYIKKCDRPSPPPQQLQTHILAKFNPDRTANPRKNNYQEPIASSPATTTGFYRQLTGRAHITFEGRNYICNRMALPCGSRA